MIRYCLGVMLAASLLVGLSTAAHAACINPAGDEGAIVYNQTYNVMQFCNGTNWLAIRGSSPSSITSMTGDVTASGSGTVTATIPNNTVTYAKMQNASSGTLLGRATAGAGVIEEITVGSGLTLSGGTLSASGGGGSSVLPSYTTTARDALSSPAAGTIILNTTTNTPNVLIGTQWVSYGNTDSIEGPTYSFTNQTNVARSTLTTSNSVTVTLTGATLTAPVSVSGNGSPKISINGGAWTTSGYISNGQTLQVRLTSSANHNTVYSAIVSVGSVSSTWSVTTVPPVSTMTFIASNNGSTATVSVPSGAQPNDIWIIMASFTSAANENVPPGFTGMQFTGSASSQWQVMAYRYITGSETSFSLQSATTIRWITMIFRPNYPISLLTWNSGNSQYTTSNPTSQTISASGSATPVVLLGQMYASGAISPRTTSPTMNEVSGASTTHYAHYKIYNSSPVNHSYDMDDEGSNSIQSGYLRLQ